MRGLLTRASSVVGLGLAIVAIVLLARFIARDWDEVSETLADARPAWIVAAFLVAAAAMTAIAIPWRNVLRLMGGDLPWPEVVARYYAGEIGKYLPGGVWPVLGRGELARRAGVPRTAAYSSVALSLALLYLAAMVVVLVAVPVMIAKGGSLASLWVLALLPIGLACLHHAVLERVRAMAARVTKREITLTIPPWGQSLAILARYVPVWLLIGSVTWLIARGLGQDVSWLDVAPATVLSWIVGFVLVPVPGGVGVREAAFVAAAPELDAGVGAAIALVARMLFVLVDAGGFGLASLWLARRRPGSVAVPGPGAAPGPDPAVDPEAHAVS